VPETRWQERSLGRSLHASTERSRERGRRFVDAARELMGSSPELDFGVQEVVRHAGLSLRSFYQHFSGKDDLLLALYEELVREAVERAEKRVAKIADPLERLEVIVHRFYGDRGAFSSPMAAEVQSLARARPDEIREALEPLLELLARVLAEAIAAGRVRRADPRELALQVLLLLLIHTQARGQQLMGGTWPVLSRSQVWDFCRRALAGEEG